MAEQKKQDLSQIHHYFAPDLFNKTWDLLDKENRTNEEELLMIHTAHASLYHWLQVGEPKQFSVGEWQVSRVYATLLMGDSALKHGLRNIDICLENDLQGFELGYAYESVARAYKVIGNSEKVSEYLKLAEEQTKLVKDDNEKKFLSDDLKTI